jgi:hypothetical protein
MTKDSLEEYFSLVFSLKSLVFSLYINITKKSLKAGLFEVKTSILYSIT